MKLALATFALVASLAAPGSADLLTVGAFGQQFPTIPAAVDAAADGDVILVRNGSYPSFVVDGKSVTIASENAVVAPPLTIRDVPVDRTVNVCRLTVMAPTLATMRGVHVQVRPVTR